MTLEENSSFCSYESVVPTAEMAFLNNFEQAFNTLGVNNSFAFFDLGLTDEEKEIFDQLDVDVEGSYQHGDNSSFASGYTEYLVEKGSSRILSLSISSILEKFVQSAQTLVNEEQIPLIFSHASTPELSNTPLMWHIDQRIYSEVSYRGSIALKGPGTMFCKLLGTEREEAMIAVNEINNILEGGNLNRTSLIEAVANISNPCPENNIYQAPSYHGAVFICGGTDLSSIHTAPIISEKRIIFTFTL